LMRLATEIIDSLAGPLEARAVPRHLHR
jgi:hypothetical protein